jgi:hypothetical protein
MRMSSGIRHLKLPILVVDSINLETVVEAELRDPLLEVSGKLPDIESI